MSKKVITGRARASYVNVFRPRKNDLSGKEEYSMMVIVPKSDKKTVSALKDAAQGAADERWGGKPPKGIRMPLRDADREADDAGEPVQAHLKGCYFMNVKSNDKPGLVDKNRMEVIDANEFQSGDYCRVSLNAFAYDVNGNRGVSFGLQNIQVLDKGEPLGSKARAEDEFDDWSDDESGEDWAA
jgi:hypothetical protein